MNLDAITAILERRIGLDPASLGPSALPDAVASRMRAVALPDPAVYTAQLEALPDEFAALVEMLVVPETWFFRGGGLFGEVAHVIATSPSAGRPYRVLSLPCSTGEEPYSLAIALLEAGIPSERWTIDGIDLSPRHIEMARRGVYREMSFRQTDAGFRDRYFRSSAEGWQLDAKVLGCVRFRVGNLMEPPQSDAYDLIFCRNLLIYLTSAARVRALDALGNMLAPGGQLAVGHAEPQTLAGRGFHRVGPEAHFLFARELPQSSPPPTARPVVRRPALANAAPIQTQMALAQSRPLVEPEDPLIFARRLADAGRLEDALAACQSHLKVAPPTAEAYSLLGTIHHARGDATASADAFRKSLYLDPANREALTHSMLLASRNGDNDRAANMRARLDRAEPEGET